MKDIAIIAITQKGTALAFEISTKLEADLFLFEKYCSDSKNINNLKLPFSKNIAYLFNNYNKLIFIMAVGIVVRVIAPYIVSKTKDPAVVVLDEKANYCISLLSGHIGGANELALYLSKITKAKPVITTATDINNVPAADILAKKNNCYIENIENLKYINGDLANNKKVGLFTEFEIVEKTQNSIVLNPNTQYNSNIFITYYNINKNNKNLYLAPKILVLGIGCKKNTPYETINNSIKYFLNKNNINIHCLNMLSSIDLKKNESGILEFCKIHNLKFKTFSSEQLQQVQSKFNESEFVKSITKVGNVCETSAYLASNKGKLIVPKTICNKITLCLFSIKYKFYIDN